MGRGRIRDSKVSQSKLLSPAPAPWQDARQASKTLSLEKIRGCVGFKNELFTNHTKKISSRNRKESNKAEEPTSCSKFLLSWLIFCYKTCLDTMFVLDFPGDSAGKELTCQYGWRGFISWVEKSPWRRKWQPTPVFFLGNPTDKGAWQATFHRVTKSQTCLRHWAQHSNHVCVTGFIQSFSLWLTQFVFCYL